MNVQLTIVNVSDVIVFKVKDAFCVLNDGRRIGCDEKFDRLRESIFGQECTRSGTAELGSSIQGRLLLVIDHVSSKFNVNEINLQFLLALDTNDQRRPTASGDNFIRVMNTLED